MDFPDELMDLDSLSLCGSAMAGESFSVSGESYYGCFGESSIDIEMLIPGYSDDESATLQTSASHYTPARDALITRAMDSTVFRVLDIDVEFGVCTARLERVRGTVSVSAAWILATGTWSDVGVWSDSETWRDSA